MQAMTWLDHLDGGTLESGTALVNSFGWNLVIFEHEEQWCVQSGEKMLLCTPYRESVDAFLYGMALSYSVVPDNILDLFREEVSD